MLQSAFHWLAFAVICITTYLLMVRSDKSMRQQFSALLTAPFIGALVLILASDHEAEIRQLPGPPGYKTVVVRHWNSFFKTQELRLYFVRRGNDWWRPRSDGRIQVQAAEFYGDIHAMGLTEDGRYRIACEACSQEENGDPERYYRTFVEVDLLIERPTAEERRQPPLVRFWGE